MFTNRQKLQTKPKISLFIITTSFSHERLILGRTDQDSVHCYLEHTDWLLEQKARQMQEVQRTHRKKGLAQWGVTRSNQETNQQHPGFLLSYRTFPASSQGGCLLISDPVIKDRKNRSLPQLKACVMLPGHPVHYQRAGSRQCWSWIHLMVTVAQSSDRGRWRRSLYATLTLMLPQPIWRLAAGANGLKCVGFHLRWRMHGLCTTLTVTSGQALVEMWTISFCLHFRTKSGG